MVHCIRRAQLTFLTLCHTGDLSWLCQAGTIALLVHGCHDQCFLRVLGVMNPIRTKRFNLFAIGLALSIQLSLPAFSQSIEEAIRLTQANQFPQALQIMEGLYQQNPEDPRVINNLAIIYNRRGVTAQTSNTSDYNSAHDSIFLT